MTSRLFLSGNRKNPYSGEGILIRKSYTNSLQGQKFLSLICQHEACYENRLEEDLLIRLKSSVKN